MPLKVAYTFRDISDHFECKGQFTKGKQEMQIIWEMIAKTIPRS